MRSFFLRTPRLGFGTWSADDLPLAVGLWGDPQVTRLIGGPFPRRWIEERLALEIATQSGLGFQYWPLFRLSDERHVGCCGLRPVPGSDDVLELGFHLRHDAWGQGYASEAARAAIEYAFTTIGVTGLIAGHHPENDASRRVLLRLGFRHTHDAYYAPTGRDHPAYALTAIEFAAAHPDIGSTRPGR